MENHKERVRKHKIQYVFFPNHTLHFFQVLWMTAAALSHLWTCLLTRNDRTAAGGTKHQAIYSASVICALQSCSPIQKDASKEHLSSSVRRALMVGNSQRDKQCQPAVPVYRLCQLVPVAQTVRPQSSADTTQCYLDLPLRVHLLGSEWQTAGGCGVCGAGTAASSTEWRTHNRTGSSSSDPPANLAVRQQPDRSALQNDQSFT